MFNKEEFFKVFEGRLYAQNKRYTDDEGNPQYLHVYTWKNFLGQGEDLSPERINNMNAQMSEILRNRNTSGFIFPEDTDPLVISQFAVFPGKFLVAQNKAANRLLSMDTKNVSYKEKISANFSPVNETFLWSEWNYDKNEPR